MKSDQDYIPFSQRTGLEPTPPQLRLGEVSDDLRRLLQYYISLEIERESISGCERSYFHGKWERVATDFHVIFLKQNPATYENSPYNLKNALNEAIRRSKIGFLFDLVEFFARHPLCSKALKGDLANAFTTARSAYRIVDAQIIAIGSAEPGLMPKS